MLLTELKTREEQDAFLSLAHTIAIADGSIGYAQQILVNMYRAEMQIDSQQPLQKSSIADACLAFIEQHTKKIVLMNLFYLAYADGYTSSQQKAILESIRLELNVNPTEVARCEEEMKLINTNYYWD